MATQGLATVMTVKLGSLGWSKSNYSSGGGAALRLLLLSPAQAQPSCSRGAVAGRWSAAASSATSAPVDSSSGGVAGGGEMMVEWPAAPREQVEAIRSLNGWVAENMLPLLTPVDSAWQPHDYLPRSTAAAAAGGGEANDNDRAFAEELAELRAAAACVPDDVLVCLVGNMVTEEALPTYQSMFNRTDGVGDDTGASAVPWARWIRGWTAEENRHGDLLNRYLYLTGRVDMRQVEITIHHLLSNGMEMLMPKSPYHSLIYASFQERATFISHGHTARLAVKHGDRTLSKICGVVAADERRHEAAYTRASAELFDVDPDGMVRALAYVMLGKVTMPGLLMSDGLGGGGDSLFARFSAVAQRAGVYTASDYGDMVEHFVRRWRVADLGAGLSGEGRRAQEYVCGLAPKIRRMEELAHRRAARGEPGLARFSWIFNRAVVVG
ncbi:acyl-[acyl-carrier-protein] desaturase 4, chloroplastic isoform X2 [Sorghum bicolor]|uniref:acyl-[acyl-carrier-protein] desaturase 4, chloroplastic isoform X2 n=1 Tax=Sorghum bicolor TaxID=4558 RepID=UPI000B42663D|nr:acyl-[acyl-carrier-protein] desaturase 4, chloroplastic isoform X2 [Sorghum bicolor]|eukprot:XP_021307960.1 acyl-[acyl-carrier-protein] desaturase 4, chloroplastic isoform X2 [Sorghum bicolor]